MPATQTRRRKLKTENPEKYAELLAKERVAAKKYLLKKKKQWEEGNHTQAEIDEYNTKKEEKRRYARDYYWKIKSGQTRKSAVADSTTPKKRPKDMSPNELRKYQSNQRRAQRAALSHQKKTAIRLKDRERKNKKREEAMLARISRSSARSSDRVGHLKKSADNLNNDEYKPKTKRLAPKYTKKALNLHNSRTPEKKHPCQSFFSTKESDNMDIKEELGIQLQDFFLEDSYQQEDISKPVNNMDKESDNLDIKEELDIELQDFLLKEPGQEEEMSKPVSDMVQASDNVDIKEEELGIRLQDSILKELDQEEEMSKPVHSIMQKLQASLDAIQDEADKAKEFRKRANKDVEMLITQLAEFKKGQLVSSKEEREVLLRHIDTLKAELKVKDGSFDVLKTKLRASKAELCVVRLQLEEIHKEKQLLEHKMAEAEAKWKSSEEDYKSQITKLEVCMKDLQEQLMSARQVGITSERQKQFSK
ncbi:GRIP and coiled-coil domain-containing protein 2 [Biomphalaria glabrata]|nr:GRIP and coiled-coil domain-containing protein 2 [Biomphalaria glabrata]